jgi:hypothetical protein
VSKGTVSQVIQRAIGDAAFRRQLQGDPNKALAGFDLTADERSAITSGDPGRLTTHGVDQRMSKAFNLSGISAASKSAVSPDLTGAGASAFIDEGTGSRTTSAIETGGSSASAANLRRIEGDLNTGAAVSAPGSSIRDAHDANTPSTSSAAGDPGAQYPQHFGLAGPSTVGASVRDAHDSSAYSAAKVDTTDASTMNLRRIEGDLNVAPATALEPADVSGDFNQLDPGMISGDSAARAVEAQTNIAEAGTYPLRPNEMVE